MIKGQAFRKNPGHFFRNALDLLKSMEQEEE